MLKAPDCKLYAAVEIGIAVMKTDPELAEQLYQIAKPLYDRIEARPKASTGISKDSVSSTISLRTRIITLAALLQKQADVDAMLAQLNALAKANGMRYHATASLYEAAGRVSPEFVIKVYDSLDEPVKKRCAGAGRGEHGAARPAGGTAVARTAREEAA